MSPLGGWHWRAPTAWRVADSALAISVLAVVLVVGNLDRMPRGVTEFLAVRVTLKNALLLAAFGWIWPTVLAACGLYAPSRLRTGDGSWPRMVFAGAIGCALAMVFPLTSRSGLVSPLQIVAFGVSIVLASQALRASVHAVHRSRYRGEPRQVVLIGSGPIARRLYQHLMSDPLLRTTVIGFVDSEPQPAIAENGLRHLGAIGDLENILMHRVVDDVFVTLPVKSCYDEIRQSLSACERVGVRASYSGDLFGDSSIGPRDDSRSAPVLSMSRAPKAELMVAKRLMDVVCAACLLVLFAPLMLAIAAIIKLTSEGPVFFTQVRYGYMKRLFRMYKFRTMVIDAERLHSELEVYNEADGPVFKIRGDPRVTRLGRFLRRSSLDELPQLWNVLVGQMSMVGPRPLATRDVGRFDEAWLMRRFSVPPGLTGLWQISGRSDTSFSRWMQLDLEYIDTWTLRLDLDILVRTVPAVFRGAGAA